MSKLTGHGMCVSSERSTSSTCDPTYDSSCCCRSLLSIHTQEENNQIQIDGDVRLARIDECEGVCGVKLLKMFLTDLELRIYHCLCRCNERARGSRPEFCGVCVSSRLLAAPARTLPWGVGTPPRVLMNVCVCGCDLPSRPWLCEIRSSSWLCTLP